MIISKLKSNSIVLLATACCIVIAFCKVAQAADDGARAYWKTLEGTNVFSFQFLPYNVDASEQLFDPSHGIYPNSETDMNLYFLSYARHINLFDRSAMITAGIYAGDISAEFHGPLFGSEITTSRTTANGFGDPSVGLTVNLFGAPNIANFYDMANYDPELTVDLSTLLTVPIGEYEEERTVNIGQNRWWGRLALPVVAYFGSFAPLYRTSFEVTPSVFLFAKNDDFLGQEMENDPLYQLEAHFTRDITRTAFGSIDFMWREGFASELNGVDIGEDLKLVALGFTLDFQINDNSGVRFSYHSNFLDDDDLDSDMARIQFYYGWNSLTENVKALQHH